MSLHLEYDNGRFVLVTGPYNILIGTDQALQPEIVELLQEWADEVVKEYEA